MKWIKMYNIQQEGIPNFNDFLKLRIKLGDEQLEAMRCVYQTNDKLIHCLTALDFFDIEDKSNILKIDVYFPENTSNDQIK